MRTAIILAALVPGLALVAAERVKLANGVLEGVRSPETGIRMFKGVPFAQPPVGDLRWKAPQPPEKWTGVRAADKFGPRCMQQALFGDMNFRSNGMSEDCLYLNVWTPAKSSNEKLPVLVYFFGGGFRAGDGSEPRYDGESMAAKGIVALSVNYRLGVFGFMAHPELTGESPHHASGNYALLDQNAALQWVRANIAAFGGDPKRVTIAGESAGSIAVSAQMASPLSKGLIAGAIGESGSIMGALSAAPLTEVEQAGSKFAGILNAKSIAGLRAIPAEKILEAAGKPGAGNFSPTIDGYFFPESPLAIFESGKQAHVPLLVGWNSEEMNGRMVLGREKATPESYKKAIERFYPANAAEILKLFPGSTEEEVIQSATDLASARFIAYSTWKWADVQLRTGAKPVYRYYYARPRPAMNASMGNAQPGLAGGVIRNSSAMPAPPARGAVHSAEIEYAMGNLASNKVYNWTPDDYKVSKTMQEYFANFIKKADPNGPGLASWPAFGSEGGPVMRIDVESAAKPQWDRERYLLLDKLAR
ncbi:MAG: carboxylesterase family protein [Acidobacteria bacterium]|nr:carboxylesterase family protein [Acidobacteriota bacterium]